jgi:hypothetical protein
VILSVACLGTESTPEADVEGVLKLTWRLGERATCISSQCPFFRQLTNTEVPPKSFWVSLQAHCQQASKQLLTNTSQLNSTHPPGPPKLITTTIPQLEPGLNTTQHAPTSTSTANVRVKSSRVEYRLLDFLSIILLRLRMSLSLHYYYSNGIAVAPRMSRTWTWTCYSLLSLLLSDSESIHPDLSFALLWLQR